MFLDNSLKTEKPLVVTMCLNSKKENIGQLETLRATKVYKALI